MLTLPQIVERPARPYLFVPFAVRMNEMQKPAQEGFPLVFAHAVEQGLTPEGGAFYNYRRIDMAATLDVEAGVAVSQPGAGAGRVQTGVLPAGRFLTVTWHGHPDQLYNVTALLVGWAKETGQHFDVVEAEDGDHFACRLEIYETDPQDEPDMNKWVTVLEFKLKD